MMSFFKLIPLTDTTGLWTFVGIQNYEKLFATAIFRKSMLNLFKIWAIGGAIVLFCFSAVWSYPDKWNPR